MNEETEEEPGKILHEMRFGDVRPGPLGSGEVYYGSIDATPLFVMLLGELRRWDLADDLVPRLLQHADRALEWIECFGDRDGDGYVEYARASSTGLANQGWKDSWDAIRFADGTLAEARIALCEVQGYVYAAYVARAHFAREAGDEVTFLRYRDKARQLWLRFNEDFWLREHGYYALGLDADKRPIDALASNLGHCLWTGIIDPQAGLVVERLMSPEMFSGWGVRTLATNMAALNPVSYHNGSIWPHDNAICAAGLMRYGYVEEAHRVIGAQLDVSEAFHGHLPELFAGFPPAARRARRRTPRRVRPRRGLRRRRCSGCAPCCGSIRGPRTMRYGSIPSSRRGSGRCGSRESRSPVSYSPSMSSMVASTCAAAVTSMCCATPVPAHRGPGPGDF